MKEHSDFGRCYRCGHPFTKHEPVHGGNVSGLVEGASYCASCFTAILWPGNTAPRHPFRRSRVDNLADRPR